MLFCSIDIHCDNCLVVVSDDADTVIYSKRLVNDLRAFCSVLEPLRWQGVCF